MSGLENLIDEVRQSQDDELAASGVGHAVRQRLAETAHRSKLAADRRPSVFGWRSLQGFAIGGGLVAAAVSAFVILQPETKPLSFTIDELPAAEGSVVRASPDASANLAFSDGSKIELGESSGMRIRKLSEHGALIQLERGNAEVKVVHRDQTKWAIEAGPYTVRVVGTEFNVEWEPTSEVLSVVMLEGQVVVEGGSIGQLSLGEGQSLRIDASKVSVLPEDGAPPPIEAEVDAEASNMVAPAASVPREPSRPRKRIAKKVVKPPRDPFQDALSTGPIETLLEIATRARRDRDGREADAYRAIRRRFPGSEAAADACFMLGRIAAHSGRHGSAEKWFNRYLDESGEGRFSAEARGRLLEISHQSGSDQRALQLAADYLRRYPAGAHAAFARKVQARE